MIWSQMMRTQNVCRPMRRLRAPKTNRNAILDGNSHCISRVPSCTAPSNVAVAEWCPTGKNCPNIHTAVVDGNARRRGFSFAKFPQRRSTVDMNRWTDFNRTTNCWLCILLNLHITLPVISLQYVTVLTIRSFLSFFSSSSYHQENMTSSQWQNSLVWFCPI